MLNLVAAQLKLEPERWAEYGARDETRRHRSTLVDLACQTDKGVVLAEAIIESLRKQHILLLSVAVIERICAEAITHANRRIYAALTESFRNSTVRGLALMHLLGFRFAPRIRDLADTKLYIPKKDARYDALKPMIGQPVNLTRIRVHWNDILRLAMSIKQGTVTASLMLRKLGSYPRQNGLALALREVGRIERTLLILDWLQNADLRRRFRLDSKEKPATRWPAPCSSTGSAKSATVVSRVSSSRTIAPVA